MRFIALTRTGSRGGSCALEPGRCDEQVRIASSRACGRLDQRVVVRGAAPHRLERDPRRPPPDHLADRVAAVQRHLDERARPRAAAAAAVPQPLEHRDRVRREPVVVIDGEHARAVGDLVPRRAGRALDRRQAVARDLRAPARGRRGRASRRSRSSSSSFGRKYGGHWARTAASSSQSTLVRTQMYITAATAPARPSSPRGRARWSAARPARAPARRAQPAGAHEARPGLREDVAHAALEDELHPLVEPDADDRLAQQRPERRPPAERLEPRAAARASAAPRTRWRSGCGRGSMRSRNAASSSASLGWNSMRSMRRTLPAGSRLGVGRR